MLCKKWEVGAMHRLENKPGMLLCCLLTKSLFHIKPVVHFPKTLTCCGFCRLLFLISMSRKGYGCCESGRVVCLRSGIKRNGPAVQECFVWGGVGYPPWCMGRCGEEQVHYSGLEHESMWWERTLMWLVKCLWEAVKCRTV